MALQVFNTLSDKKEAFVPAEPGRVRMYVCGVTVYDNAHVGHARCYVTFDVVYRTLRALGNQVTYVRNFTDLDDKIINRALREGVDFREITARYIASYHEEMAALGNLPPDVEPKVTEHLPEILAAIEAILARGLGYVAEGDVYFSVRDLPSYGELSKRSFDDMRAGERVEVDPRKRDPMDFALWKAAKPGEPAWDSPWGPGRPGWHIECTAMSRKHLGADFDLHGGGRDLIFPHHENEIAQAKGCGSKTFARYWLHNGFVNMDKEKMSKSLGNIVSLGDLLRAYHPEALRLFLLGTHYRHPIAFAPERLEEATERLQYYYETLAGAREIASPTAPDDAGRKVREAFVAAMEDDFNVPAAVAAMSEAFTEANKVLQAKKGDPKARAAKLGAFLALVRELGPFVGLWERDPADVLEQIKARFLAKAGIDRAEVDRLIAERAEARAAKDWARADALRGRFAALGVEVKDGPQGTVWSVKRKSA